MAGRNFGRKKNYGLTVTVSSKPWWLACRKKSTTDCFLVKRYLTHSKEMAEFGYLHQPA